MKILLTGITGYIGSNLARYLLKKHDVYGLVRIPFNTTYIHDIQSQITLIPYNGDGCSLANEFLKYKPDIVFHLATYYTSSHMMEHIDPLITSNILLGAHLLEAMASSGVHNLIYTSSVMEFSNSKGYSPLNLYAATKRAFSDLLTYYANCGYIKYGTILLSDTYGPGDKRPKILNLVNNAAKNHEKIDLSDGQQDYAVVHIDDVVEGLVLAGTQLYDGIWYNKIFQMLPDKIMSLRDVIELMMKQKKLSLHANWGAKKGSKHQPKCVVRIYPNIPNWSPKVDLEIGLKEM